MKFNNKLLLAIIIVICAALYFSINILPGIFIKSIEDGNSSVRTTSKIGSNDLNIQGMSVITRSDKVYYSPNGPIPTNKIWSSVVFKGNIDGLYTYPFASNTKDGALNITIPKKYIYDKIVAAQIISEYISVKGVDDVDKVSVQSYGDISVKLDFLNKFGSVIFTATYIQGSPYIFIKPNQNTVKFSSNFYNLEQQDSDWIYKYSDNNLGIFSNGSFSSDGNNLQVNFSNLNEAYVTIAALDMDHFSDIKSMAGNVVDEVDSTYQINDSNINISYNFKYLNPEGGNTLLGLLPNQYQDKFDLSKALFKFNTLRGDQYFVQTSESLTYSIQRIPLVSEFKFEALSDQDKVYIGGLIEQDLKDIVYVRSSAYFGGNDILKLANLLEIANNIGNQDLVTRIKTRLDEEFADWFSYKDGENGKYFAFDEAWGGVIGYETAGFGGENYNDHHFQYGYFIHAAAILAKFDPDFLTKYGYFIDDLVHDIANNNKDDPNFPYLRYFDQYEGHSWAVGLAENSDGNNQESSSEAINAWYGLWLWSQVTNDNTLRNESEYLYSSEVNSARIYWLNWNEDKAIFPEGYKPLKAGVVWGGKFEYQTFFSTEPQSIEGIQYLPFTPGAMYLYNQNIIIRDYLAFGENLSDMNANLSDMNHLYYAILGGFGILSKTQIENMKIDQGNSRANIYYWVKFWDNVGSLETLGSDSGTPVYRVTYKDGIQTIL